MTTKRFLSNSLPLLMVFAFILLPMMSAALPTPESPEYYYKCIGTCRITPECYRQCLGLGYVHGGECRIYSFGQICCCRLNDKLQNGPISKPILTN